MKKLVLSLGIAVLFTTTVCAQAVVSFANRSASGGIVTEAPITNSITGERVVGGTTFLVQLYVAPEGTMDENQLMPVGAPIGFLQVVPGIFNGGNVTLPLNPATIQVRVWESAYGANYEAAAAAGVMNGRTALLGKSALLHVPFYDRIFPPKNLVQLGMVGFALQTTWSPSLSINDRVISEGTNGTKQVAFTVTLFPASTQNVSVDYATADDTAQAGSDYTAASGTLSFASGETTKTVSVTVTADAPVEPDEIFYINLSNPVNAPIEKGQGSCLITEVRVTSIRLDVAIGFNTVPNRRYIVEKADDFVTWTPVAGAEDVPGTGAIVTVYDIGGGASSQRIYRARLIE